jgi:hypothetical protein
MTFALPAKQQNPLNYTGFGIGSLPAVQFPRAPLPQDIDFPIFTIWRNSNPTPTPPDATGDAWLLSKFNGAVQPYQAVWIKLSTASGGDLETLTPDSGGAVSPVAANINVHGTNGITTSNGGTAQLNINLPTTVAITFDGDIGSATPAANVITFNANTNSGSSVEFSGSGSTISLLVTDTSSNTIIGLDAGDASITGVQNTALGQTALGHVTSSSFNTALGQVALNALTTGNGTNTAVGQHSLSNLTTGSGNSVLGQGTGNSYTTNESSNVLINSVGVIGDNNTLRIGGATGSGNQQLNKAFIQGISGNTVSNPQVVMINSATGQLGSAATGGGLSWDLASVNTNMVSNTGYIADGGGRVTLTLPATSNIGDVISVVNSINGFMIAQNAGQQITFASQQTTVGTSGNLSSTQVLGEAVTLLCIAANTDWQVISSIGTLHIM